MKKHQLRRLRAQFLAQQVWAIHPPALSVVMELLDGPAAQKVNRREVQQRLGMTASDEPPSTRMLGTTAVIPLVGILQPKTNYVTRWMGGTALDLFERDFRAAAADANVKAIVVYCDSPGGSAMGTEEAFQTVFAARGKKPIRAYTAGMCASACYYVAAACDQIVASPTSTVGSIGTILTLVEYSKALDEMGVKVNLITHGTRKADGSPYQALTAEARAQLQSYCDSYGALFDNAVGRGRGVSADIVKTKFGGGAFYVAGDAKARGLIDAVGSLDELLAQIAAGSSQVLENKPAAGPLRIEFPLSADLTGSAVPFQLTPDWFRADEARYQAAAQSTVLSVSPSPAVPATRPAVSLETPMKIKAALFARGLIDSLEASAEICQAAVRAFFSALGREVPTAEADVLAALNGTAAATTVAQVAAPLQAAPATTVNPAQAAHDREVAEARAAAAGDERKRMKDITASGKLLNLSQEKIDAAISSNKPHAEVISAWHAEAETQKPPVATPTTATIVSEGAERFAVDAVSALQLKMGRTIPDAARNDSAQRLSRAPLHYFAKQCLQHAGQRVDEFVDAETVAEQALQMDGQGRFSLGMDSPVLNRPGSFPNLLSALANKVLDDALELSDATYALWTGMWPTDLPDFKPSPIINKGRLDELDEVLDSEASKELAMGPEEMLGYMLLARYSNMVGLTPVMVANDDLGAFSEDLIGLAEAMQNTTNRLCYKQLTANVTLLDGNPLFDDSTHANVITSGGGAPSTTTWGAMRLKVSAQRGVGNKGRLRSPLKIALVPPKWYEAALQTFAPYGLLPEMKVPTADTSLNIYRGQVRVVEEPELQDSSTDIWFGLCDNARLATATVLRAYFRGWGRNGRRQRFYDPKTKTWYVELEQRVGAAAKQYRTAVRNPGG